MKKTSNLFLLIFAVVFFSCNKPNGYIIKGDLTGFPDSTVFYLQNSSTQEVIDSAIIIKNNLEFKGQFQDTPEEIFLTAKVDGKFIYSYLLIGNEKISVSGDIKDFPWNVAISGSKSQDDYNILRSMTKSFDIERDSLVQSFFKLSQEEQEAKGKAIWDEINSIDDTTNSIRVRFTKTHINTYPGIINLGYLKKSLPKDTVLVLYNMLNPDIKASKYARVLEIFLNEDISEIGDMYHDFEAFNKDGDKIKFSELTGQYILLDFTAANCGPCVQSAEELRLIEKTYNDSLKIVSFSTDARKETWLESLNRDSVSWLSLWDGKGIYSETYIKYGVQGFPTFFLINPSGKIIDKWAGYGKGSLEAKLNRFKDN
ncbi:MAG: AhpC/TSA family protein [Bacteroidales bacterium]|nr:AhpC/TSA family protein [Bacteroidales bacterium]